MTQAAQHNESFYRQRADWCADTSFTGMLHPGKRCYRQIPNRKGGCRCPGGDQVCFDIHSGAVDHSPDSVAPVNGRDAQGYCTLDPVCAPLHGLVDVLGNFGQEPPEPKKMTGYRLTFARSTLEAPPYSAAYAADFLVLPSGELLVRASSGNIGGFSDIFRTIGIIGAQTSGAIAAAIPGVSNGVANIIGTAAQAAAGQFLVPKPPGGPARGLAQVQAFCNQVLQALDNLIAQAASGQIDHATVYAHADQLVALLSDPTAVYQAQHGDDANALNTAKAAAAQKAQQAKQAADAVSQAIATGQQPGTVTTPVIDPATGQIIQQPAAAGSLDITTIAIIAGAGLALGWLLS